MIKQKGHLPSAPFVPSTVGTRTADQLIQPVQAARGSRGSSHYLHFPNAETGLRENQSPTDHDQAAVTADSKPLALRTKPSLSFPVNGGKG